MDLFFYYYNSERPLKEIALFGKKIIFKATKSFSTLLKKNKIIEDKIVIFTKEIYFEEINSSETN